MKSRIEKPADSRQAAIEHIEEQLVPGGGAAIYRGVSPGNAAYSARLVLGVGLAGSLWPRGSGQNKRC